MRDSHALLQTIIDSSSWVVNEAHMAAVLDLDLLLTAIIHNKNLKIENDQQI